MYVLVLTSPTDYPLPPNEEKTEIMRVVVRESMSMDLLDRLVSDILAVTESMTTIDSVDLATWQPFHPSVEKKHASAGIGAKEKEAGESERPMEEGVHRSVC